MSGQRQASAQQLARHSTVAASYLLLQLRHLQRVVANNLLMKGTRESLFVVTERLNAR